MRAPTSSRILCAGFLFLVLLVHNVGATPGDVDNDGVLSFVDMAMIKYHLDRSTPLTTAPLSRADANSDGKINAADIIRIRENLSTSDATITFASERSVYRL